LIFFVTFLHQGKKVKALYSKGNPSSKYLLFILLKSKKKLIDRLSGSFLSINFNKKLSRKAA
jgi:hypothetical protein